MSTLREEPPSARSLASRRAAPDLLSPLISLVLFGYYGFVSSTTSDLTNENNETVALWLAFLWSMRVVALLFAGCVVLALTKHAAAHLALGICGLVATATLATLGLWDASDTNYQLACPTLLLWIFVAWNGYASITTLRESRRNP